jgi:hypothetical protein
MRLLGLLLVALLLLPISAARGQNFDRQAVCPLMGEALVKRVAALVKGKGQCEAFCTAGARAAPDIGR